MRCLMYEMCTRGSALSARGAGPALSTGSCVALKRIHGQRLRENMVHADQLSVKCYEFG